MKKTGSGVRKTGRPTVYGEVKVNLCLRVTPTLIAFLRSQSDSIPNTIEDMARRTARFKRWAEEKR